MKQAISAVVLVAAVAIGFIVWIAGDIAPKAEFVPHVAATQPAEESDYLRAAYSPLHFRPAIESATDGQCLACHREVIEDKVRAASPAGQKAELMRAWYQQTSTYSGGAGHFPQATSRHAAGEAVDEPAMQHLPPGTRSARGSAGCLCHLNTTGRHRIHLEKTGESRNHLSEVPRRVSLAIDGHAGAMGGAQGCLRQQLPDLPCGYSY